MLSRPRRLRVVLLKASKYNRDGYVERFRWGSMPNSSLPYLHALTPTRIDSTELEVVAVDEYVHTDLDYLELLDGSEVPTLVALVGVQSHQLHRAIDLAALARRRGSLAILGGPHPMTCDTTALEGTGVSFALSEAERIWETVLRDAIVDRQLAERYGGRQRWEPRLEPPPLPAPSRRHLRRYASRMLGIYPARGCPYRCNFCSIIKIAGHEVRGQPVDTTIASLRNARAAGARAVFFTSDNFNKYPQAPELLEAMLAERIDLPFFVQCDVQVARQPDLVELLGRAGCFQMFLGVESFDRATLKAAHKFQNQPSLYRQIVELCRRQGIATTFANILGFPQDTAAGIRHHVEILREIGPEMAAFYILTPIPGTEQYAEFLSGGLLREPNLDRYDASSLTWEHPSLSDRQLQDLLVESYRRFFRLGDAMTRGVGAIGRSRAANRSVVALNVLAHSLLTRYAAGSLAHLGRGRGEASMEFSAGIARRRLDHVDDYLPLRRSTYGFELAPLPQNLELSAADEALNQRAKLPVADGPLRLALS